ncbi:MAG: ABC transporter permease, partial [Bryobacterales bacterium]|nr:ABC transporter permease [Bryobacterales bacterium]
DRILFRPLPYANAQELVWFGMKAPIGGTSEFILEQNYQAWRKQPLPFAAMTVTSGAQDCSLSELNPVRLRCMLVSEHYLSLFGYRPLTGRDFREEDSRAGAPRVALISPALWRQRFGAGDITGKSLAVDGHQTGVIGVLPENFETPALAAVDILQVLQLEPNKADSAPSLLLTAFARLRPGVTAVEARTRMEPLFEQALQSVPPGFRKEVRFVIHPLRERQVQDSERAALLLLGAVALVLLIAVANVANMLLARTANRRKELAVRAAMGAARGRLARLALTESLSLGLLAGVCGLAFAALLLDLFRQLAPAGIARLGQATLDWRIGAFCIVVTLAASVLFGLAPAMTHAPPEILTGVRIAGHRRQWLRPALVIVQITLSLLLLCGASLLLQSLRNMANAPLGMETHGLFSAYAQLPDSRYRQPAQRTAFWNSAMARVAAIPGVQASAMASSLPPQGRTQGRIFSSIYEAGKPRPVGKPTGGMVVVREVSPDYFRLLRVPLRQGRLPREREKDGLLLSEQMAARMFPGQNPLGRRVVLSGEATLEVIGVVGNVRNMGLTASTDPEIYLPANPERERQYLLLRADARVMPFVTQALRELDPRLTIDLETLDDRVRGMRARPLFQSTLLSGFALAGLLLAAIGLYGVVSLLVVQRTGEIGIRVALGATASDIQAMMLCQAGAWIAAGLALGSACGMAGAQLLEGMLYEVKPGSPLPLAVAASVLVLTALLAAWLPARRAAKITPVEALREL